MEHPQLPEPFEQSLCVHIFSASAGLVGICLTVIGLLRVVITLKKINTMADDLLALDAGLFLTSCVLSYWTLRRRGRHRMHRVERTADAVFLSALGLMVTICLFITYAIAAD